MAFPKKTLLLFSFLLLILPNLAFSQETFMVSSSAEMNYNDHVGNEWATRTDLTIDGKSYDISHSRTADGVKITPSSSITVTGTAQEDDKYPDTGKERASIDASELLENDGGSYSFTVTVREDRGRYAGNTAEWVFTVRFRKE